ncbi:MAG TPA: hypothetical protein PKI14_00410 [Fervidobacterium sp.]|nr:hypothetical protein [Fervidobacterium sp.]HOK87828.1 hypothetical protein [Fervidobacterium sp.]HOM74044.1 hypothetical protein [Fervidobacterium sp.]HOQ38940.1 hypothetical protein [Fervidobacterium sp.]HPP17767.1 hypothetical protein [Fervidobacterium sp.]
MRKFLVLTMTVVCVIFMFAQDETDELTLPEECACEISHFEDSLVLPDNEELEIRITNVEEYLNLIYELISEKVDSTTFEAFVEELNGKIDEICVTENEMEQAIEELKVVTNIIDSDILKIYEILGEHGDALSNLLDNTLEMFLSKEEAIFVVDDIVSMIESVEAKIDTSYVQLFEEDIGVLESENEELFTRLLLLEEYVNVICDITNSKVSLEELDMVISSVNSDIEKLYEKDSEQDKDILILYDAVDKLAEEVRRLSGKISLLETILRESTKQ